MKVGEGGCIRKLGEKKCTRKCKIFLPFIEACTLPSEKVEKLGNLSWDSKTTISAIAFRYVFILLVTHSGWFEPIQLSCEIPGQQISKEGGLGVPMVNSILDI